MKKKLNWRDDALHVEEAESAGPGNVVMIELEHEHVTELFTGFGEKQRSAEHVAGDAVRPCRRYLKSEAPAGEYLTDQLLLPLAIAGGGAFRSTGLSRHATTHIDLIRQFLDVDVKTEESQTRTGVTVQVTRAG